MQLYRQHVQREAWDHHTAAALPERVKDVASAAELLAKPPNLDAHVFCVALRDCDPVVLGRGAEAVQLAQSDIALLPYGPLRPLIAAGDVQLT